MQKTAKNISLSVAGMMVAVPAGADIASIDYVQRWVQNQSPIPAGSVISGYASGSYGSYLLAGSTVGGPYSGVSISDLASKIPGSKITGYAPLTGFSSTGYAYGGWSVLVGSGSGGPYGYVGMPDLIGFLGKNLGSFCSIGYGSEQYFIMGDYRGGLRQVAGSHVGMTYGSMWGSYMVFNSKSGIGSSPYVLMGSSSYGSAGWVQVSGSGNNSDGLTSYLFRGNGTGKITHVLAAGYGSTGQVPSYHSVNTLGTVIGTVEGSQVKIEQTTTAEELQKNTGTIYFPVVQNGTIYGVTLNDFYILMNAQF